MAGNHHETRLRSLICDTKFTPSMTSDDVEKILAVQASRYVDLYGAIFDHEYQTTEAITRTVMKRRNLAYDEHAAQNLIRNEIRPVCKYLRERGLLRVRNYMPPPSAGDTKPGRAALQYKRSEHPLMNPEPHPISAYKRRVDYKSGSYSKSNSNGNGTLRTADQLRNATPDTAKRALLKDIEAARRTLDRHADGILSSVSKFQVSYNELLDGLVEKVEAVTEKTASAKELTSKLNDFAKQIQELTTH